MNMQRIFHTPEGVRDIYGEECSRKKRLQRELHQVFSRYGYEDIETPAFEYFEVDRKSTRLNSSHTDSSRMPSSA